MKNIGPEEDLNNFYGVVFPKGWKGGEKFEKRWYKKGSNGINSDKKKEIKQIIVTNNQNKQN